jgi:hypothetical protein
MYITEYNLRSAIQIALGMRGIYNDDVEEALIHHVKALSISGDDIKNHINANN